MIPHYGKREPGLLTAASPGDTLYFPFMSFNDSGNSEALTGLALTDIEVFKNGAATARATDSGYSLISDTGQLGDRAGLYRVSVQLFNTADDATFYATGSHYLVAIDAVTIDGKTVRMYIGQFEIGRDKVNVLEINSDTGAANWLQDAFTSGFNDTGINNKLDRIGFDVDTGLRAHISDVDTGLHDHISDIDTGLRDHIDNTDTGLRRFLDNFDTGIKQRFNALAEDTGGVNVNSLQGDTGAVGWMKLIFAGGFNDTGVNQRFAQIQSDVDTGLRVHIDDSDTGIKDAIADLDTGLRDHIDNTDTGLRARINTLAEDTGGVNINSIQGDTGAAGWLRATFAGGFHDTGVNERFGRIQSDVDTGLRVHIDDSDTGVKDAIADLDTGLCDYINDTDTGLRAFIDDIDTGLRDTLADYDTGIRDYIDNTDTGLRARINTLAEDTGGVNVNSIFGDTGAANQLKNAFANGFNDTGMNAKLDAIKTKTDSLTYTVAGQVDANIQSVNDVTVTGTGVSGNTWGP